MFERALALPEAGRETFFLWGPRQAGKSTLLRRRYPDALWVDLLKSEVFRRYLDRPELLRQELASEAARGGRQVVIDEVQKVPALLDEVHWLIENRGHHFALCGSSARKVRRGAANLLGGRAIRYELRGLTAAELGAAFDLDRMLNHGYLPRIYQAARPRRLLDAYVADYLREEVAAEGLVRNLPAFSGFLDAAAFSDGEMVNFSNVARECGVASPTAKAYFEILEDTLLGRRLHAYRRRRKRRVIGAPKFYFADVGVVNRLTRRGELSPGAAALREGVRELGISRAVCRYRVSGVGSRPDLLAAAERHRGGLRARRHGGGGGGKSECPHYPRPPARSAHAGRRAPRHSPAHRRLPGTARPPYRRRHRHPSRRRVHTSHWRWDSGQVDIVALPGRDRGTLSRSGPITDAGSVSGLRVPAVDGSHHVSQQPVECLAQLVEIVALAAR